MGHVFEIMCKEYLLRRNKEGRLPILFANIGRWWGTDSSSRSQVEIHLIAKEGTDYLICECKWRNEPLDYDVLQSLEKKADAFRKNRGKTWYALFSKSGFTEAILEMVRRRQDLALFTLEDML